MFKIQVFRNGKHVELPLNVIIEVIPHKEDIPVRGNVLWGADPQETKAVEDKIIKRLRTNIWAWCCVEVKASIGGFNGSSYLGSCSYKNEEDFKKNSSYYPQMAEEAIAELAKSLEKSKIAHT